MRYLTFVLISIVILGGVWLLSRAKQPLPAGEEDTAGAQTAVINGHVLELEVARTREEHARGLSDRESLAENAGMLFVFEQPEVHGFWMKDMNFPLDLLWIDENGKLVAISENVVPETYPEIFRPPSSIVYVLEVTGGWARNHNISIGEEVQFDF